MSVAVFYSLKNLPAFEKASSDPSAWGTRTGCCLCLQARKAGLMSVGALVVPMFARFAAHLMSKGTELCLPQLALT
jgi:hypothetical protein